MGNQKLSNTKVVKAGIGYTVGNYLLKGFSFITVPIFARMMTTDDFGIYSTFVAYETILFIILGCAFHSSYNSAKTKYDINNDNPKLSYPGYISVTIEIIIINTVILLLTGILFSSFLSPLLGLSRIQIVLLVLYSFATAVITCYNTNASINYDYMSYIKVAGLNAVLNLSVSIILMLTIFNTQRYMGRIIGTVLPMFIISAVIAINFLREKKPGNRKIYAKWGLKYSVPIVFHGLSQVILSQFDRIMIRNMIGDTAAGIYSFGYTVFSIINVTFTSLDSVWVPWFYKCRRNNELDSIKKYSSIYAIGILVLCICLMLACPELIIVLGSAKYVEAQYCTIPIVASGFFVFLYTLPSCVEYYHEKTSYIAIATTFAAGMNVILNYYFILKYGYIAAAYTTLFTYILYFLVHYIIARKIEKMFLFSNRIILFCSAAVITAMIIALKTIKYVFIRWILVILVFCIFIYYEEKELGAIKLIYKKIQKR